MFIAIALPDSRLLANKWNAGGPYRIGWTQDPPEMFAGPNGEPQGLTVELVREAARRRGIALHWVRHPENSESALRSGKVDLWPLMTITPERLKVVHISAPYLDSVVSFMVRRDSRIQSVQDLSGQMVGFVSAARTGTMPTPINLQLARQYLPEGRFIAKVNGAELIASLCRHEIAAAFIEQNEVIRDLLIGTGSCGQQGFTQDGFNMITPPGSGIKLGVGSTMQASAAADAIRDEIDSMSADGWLAGLFSRWGYLSGRSVAYVDSLRASRQRERWTLAAASLFALLFVFTLWQTVRYFREARRARRAEAALRESMTESRHMGERLRENKQRLEEAQQMARVGSFTTDARTGQMEWTEELYRIFELDSSDSTPSFTLVMERAHADDRKLIQEKMSPSSISAAEHFEHRLLMPDGRVKHLLVTITGDADGGPQARGTVQDITERKQTEEHREQLERQLAQARQMESIGRLAGGVAHDFNNMLTVILGYAALLKSELPPGTMQQKRLLEIEKAGDRARQMTQKLLGFSRQQIIAPVPSNLNYLVEDLTEPLGRLIGEDIELGFLGSKDLWTVLVDASQVNQILLNLVVNARDAMPSGGKLTIETTNGWISAEYCQTRPEAQPGAYVLLSVTDTGVGISPEVLPRIFEPFFTTKGIDQGTGLGLSMVYGIAKQNGGFVNAYSEPGHGSAFRVYFPRIAGEPTHGEALDTGAVARRGRGTILVVEDDELVRELVTSSLKSVGYKPVTARSPAEAIELCSSAHGSQIGLVLTDVVMPGMNGMELRDRICAVRPEMRVLFMSGYTSNVIVKHGILKAGVHFIQKPFTVDELSRRVEELLT